jgi:hypothetical protein
VVKDIKYNVEERLYSKQLNEMVRLSTPSSYEMDNENGNKVSEPAPHYIPLSIINVGFYKSELRSIDDVEKYIQTLKKQLIEQISNNKRIIL